MTTTVDICNRALQLIGLQKKISALTQDSAEAQALNTALTPVSLWCYGLANWNFARSTAVLTVTKTQTVPVSGAWANTKPAPPWLFEYSLPADYVRAIYVTNSAIATDLSTYLGEPQRFVIANGTVSAVEQPVLLTNQSGAILVYTATIADPTQWPWYFERLVVTAIAQAVCVQLTSNMQMFQELTAKLEQQISISMQLNQAEGLYMSDATPEWTQALGINYPFRRLDSAANWQSDPAGGQQPAPSAPVRPVGPTRKGGR